MQEEQRIKVYHTFVNKKGETKNVNFYMDRLSYEMCLKLSKEDRNEYLLNKYREYCKEQKYKRRNITFSKLESKVPKNDSFDEEKELFVIEDDYNLYEEQTKKLIVEELERCLNEEEYEVYYMHFFLQKSNVDIARTLKVTEGAVRYKIKKIIEKLRNYIK